jgi:DNA-binding CsgD family transcriptional regulator
MNRSDKHLSSMMAELAEYAATGKETWHTFNSAFSELYPGSVTSFAVLDRKALVPVMVVTEDIEPELERAYFAHFGKMNPWNAFWPKIPVGRAYPSSSTQPSSTFARTEFYNDWLLKLGVRDCVGMKLLTSDNEIINFSTMLPLAGLEINERHALKLYASIAGNIVRGVQAARVTAQHGASAIAGASIIERSPDFAAVLNHRLGLVAANDTAEAHFRANEFAYLRAGRFTIRDPEVMAWLESSVRNLLVNGMGIQNRRPVHWKGRYFLISISHLPTAGAGVVLSTLLHSFQVLVVIKEMSRSVSAISSSLLSQLFSLTAGEAAICLLLREGMTVTEIADTKQLSRETVRFHLKSIFRKCGTNRQADLVSLLQRVL